MKKEEKARVRVFFGEIEGDNETIRDGLRSIAQAVNRTFQPEIRVVRVIGTGEGSNGSQQLAEDLEKEIRAAELAEDSSDVASDDSGRPSEKAKQKAQKKARTFNLVTDMNLRPDGKQSFREFFRLKSPDGAQQIVTVAIYYMQKIAGVTNITVHHVYTAFKEVSDQGVRVPASLDTTLQDVIRRKGWIENSDSNGWTTTVRGENFVEQDLNSMNDGHDS